MLLAEMNWHAVSKLPKDTPIVFPVAALPCLATTTYMVFAARREERDMEQRFPGTYSEYMRRSKFIVPFLL